MLPAFAVTTCPAPFVKTPTALLAPVFILLIVSKVTFPPSLYSPVPPLPTVTIPFCNISFPRTPTEFSPTVTVPVFVILSPAFVNIPTLGLDAVNGFVKVMSLVFSISVPSDIIP